MFGDGEARVRFLAAGKALGREVRGFDEQRWNAARRGIVVQGNLAKFGQHPVLGIFLVNTNDRVLVESSPVDRVRGIGLAEDDPRACAAGLSPHLRAALSADTWRRREAHLVPAYETIARMHNALGITEPLPEQVRDFFGRPFKVIALHGFSGAITARIADDGLCRLAARPLIGSIDQLSDSTDLVSHAGWRPALRRLYE